MPWRFFRVALVKIEKSRASDRELRYAYVLTPQGLAQKAALTRRFLARKLQEYERLRDEIAAIQAGLGPE